MRRRIIYIILGALLILALIVGLWFWFFGGSATPGSDTGSFGEGGTRAGTGANTGANGGNSQTPIGSTGSGVQTNTGGGTSGVDTGGVNYQIPVAGTSQSTTSSITSGTSYFTPLPDTSVSSDVVWNTGSLSGSQNILFNPTPINSINTTDINGNPLLRTPVIGPDGKEVSLLGGLGVVIGGCILAYGETLIAGKAGSFIQKLIGFDIAKVQVAAQSTNESVGATSIRDCLVRTLGKLAVQSITDSTVNWINSGFNGKPAYVQNYKQFFASVTDQAAGEFLQASNFAFLCSPFKLQVRIAIAQSYARRGSSAPSCTLSQAVGNVESFLNGNFSEGGWRGLISLTTEDSNNPFTAFMTLSGGLQNAQGQAQANATLDINLGRGFLSVQHCDPTGTSDPDVYNAGTKKAGQNCKIVTPGAAIESSLAGVVKTNLESLQIGESIDQILSALTNALLTKALYGGLANVGKNTASASTGLSPAQQQANALMDELRGSVTAAQQYATIEQRTITDIQVAQQNLIDLQNCWLQASSTPNLTAAQIATAQAGVGAAAGKVAELQLQVDLHNQRITQANTTISQIQELQTDLLLATVSSEVTRVKTTWTSMKASNQPRIYTNTDITTAQQDRTSTQNNLVSVNLETSTKLQQCYALGV